MRKIYLCLLLLGLQTALAAQGGGVWPRGYRTFGLNAGWSYQSSDVSAARGGFGFGATLAKNHFSRPGSLFALDTRWRLLYARQYGLDAERSFAIADNKALNGTFGLNYLEYPAALNEPNGFVFQNHRTDVGELSFEGVIMLNRLRERTRWIVAIYGGIGLDWYRTKIDQTDTGGNPYYSQYASLKEGQSAQQVRQALREDILDGNYETLADGFDRTAGKLGFMPSVGAEIGYQLFPRFYIFGAHRITFAGTDVLDGHQWKDDGNDRYHYTHLGMRWILGRRQPRAIAPVIDITNPAGNPHRSYAAGVTVRANIRNIERADQIEAQFNGRQARFDYDRGLFTADVLLRPGENEMVITARNGAGSARERLIILFQEELIGNPVPPVSGRRPSVTLTNPPRENTVVQVPDFTIMANVSEVNSPNDITVLFNDRPLGNVSFDPRSGRLTVPVQLQQGTNSVRIEVRNPQGRDEAQGSVSYESASAAPFVSITDPSARVSDSNTPNVRVRAEVRNVARDSEITVLVNGRSTRSFSYYPDQQYVRIDLTLQAGSNRISVRAENQNGRSEDEVAINYGTQQKNPPTVFISTPARDTRTSSSTTNVEATVRNVERKEDVEFVFNGRRINNFSFSPSSGQVSAVLTLQLGNNTINITGRNRDGSATESVNVNYDRQQVVQPGRPSVTIARPTNGSSVSSAQTELLAQTSSVGSKGELSLFVNNQPISNFTFNAARQEVTASVTLREGSNEIRLSAQNSGGSASDQVRVTFSRQQLVQPNKPSVAIARPTNGSSVSSAQAELQANVSSVGSKGELSLFVNNQPISNFTFNAARQEVTASVTLREGSNEIRLSAQNSGGSASDQVRVTYNKPVQRPTVTITSPSGSQFTSPTASTTVRATVTGVAAKSDIEVYVRNSPTSQFTYNHSRQEVTLTTTLTPGANAVRIKASNSAGSGEAQTNITYRLPVPPKVTITAPSDNAQLTSSFVTVQANITGVSDRKGIRFLVNGKEQKSFNFSGTQFSAEASGLKAGANTLAVRAQNNDGSDEATVRVNYQPPPPTPKPVVVFLNPPKAGTTTGNNMLDLLVSIEHVESTVGISLLVNKSLVKNFTFDTKTKRLQAQVTLSKGRNTFSVEAVNAGGSASASSNIVYEPAAVVMPPVVRIESMSEPVINPMNPGIGRSTVIATFDHVSSSEQIQLWINGNPVTGFSYDTAASRLQHTFDLQPGTNTATIRATNGDGSNEASRSIEF